MKKNNFIKQHWKWLLTIPAVMILIVLAIFVAAPYIALHRCSSGGQFVEAPLACTNVAQCVPIVVNMPSCEDLQHPTPGCLDYTRGIGCTNQECSAWVYEMKVC